MKFVTKCFIVSTVIAVAARTVQILFLTDAGTAFLNDEIFYNVLASLGIALPVVYTAANALIAVRQPKTVGTVGVTTAVFSCISALLYIIGGFSAVKDGRTGGIVSLLFACVSAVGCVLFAVASVKNIRFPKVFTVLFVVGWTAETIITYLCFAEHPLRANVVLNMLAVVFAVLFFIFFGKAYTKVSAGMSFRLMYPAGLLVGMLTAVSVIPEFTVSLMGKSELINPSPVPPILLMAAAVFAVTVTLSTFRKSNTKRRKE